MIQRKKERKKERKKGVFQSKKEGNNETGCLQKRKRRIGSLRHNDYLEYERTCTYLRHIKPDGEQGDLEPMS